MIGEQEREFEGDNERNLHNDEDSNIDASKSGPSEPANVRKLAHTRTGSNDDRANEGEPDRANGMQRQGIERGRDTDDTRRSDNNIADCKQKPDHFLQERTAHNMRHIGDGVAAWVGIAKVALHNSAVCVEKCPTYNIEGTRESSQFIH